jgi:SAM-dependent methyltransferase
MQTYSWSSPRRAPGVVARSRNPGHHQKRPLMPPGLTMRKSIHCEACGSLMRRKKAWLYRCPVCGFFASLLRPAEGTGVPGLEALRRRNFEIMLDHLQEIRPLAGTRILEVGSAWGWFLEAAKRRGANVRGIEPESVNAERAKRGGLDVEVGFFPADLRDREPYDMIIFNDVFEHLPNPSILVAAIQKLLSPNGLMVLNLPSSDGVLFRVATILDVIGSSGWLERLWQKDFPSPHVSYFNPGNLRRLVERHSDLKLVAAFPLNSVSRDGLAARIHSSHRGVKGAIAFLGLWALSFLLPRLPTDIHVAVFRSI